MQNARVSSTHFITLIGVLAGFTLIPAQSLAQSGTLSMFHAGPEHAAAYEPSAGAYLTGIQWRVTTNGDVIGSPVISGNTVYIASGDGRLYALDLLTGAQRWLFDARNPIPSSAAVGDNRVYFGTRNGNYYAVDASTPSGVECL